MHAGQRFVPSVGVRETLNQPQPAESFGGETEIPWTIERRLKGVRVQKSEEDERNFALKKLQWFSLIRWPRH